MTQDVVNESLPPIWWGHVEDRINTALNATLAAHDLLESFLCAVGKLHPERAEEANTNSYMIGHCRERVRDAHDLFHAYLAQELAKRRAA